MNFVVVFPTRLDASVRPGRIVSGDAVCLVEAPNRIAALTWAHDFDDAAIVCTAYSEDLRRFEPVRIP